MNKYVCTYLMATDGYTFVKATQRILDFYGNTQGKNILDTLQEKGYFLCKSLPPCRFLTRFLLLAKNCARNVIFLAQFLQDLQVSYKKVDINYLVHIQCTKRASILARYFPWEFLING